MRDGKFPTHFFFFLSLHLNKELCQKSVVTSLQQMLERREQTPTTPTPTFMTTKLKGVKQLVQE